MLDRMWLAFSAALFVTLIVFTVMYFKKRIFIIETAFKDQAEIVQNILGMFNTMMDAPGGGEKTGGCFAPKPDAPPAFGPMSVLGGGLSGIGDILGMMGDTGAETMMFFNGGLDHAEYAARNDMHRAHACEGARSMVVEDITDAAVEAAEVEAVEVEAVEVEAVSVPEATLIPRMVEVAGSTYVEAAEVEAAEVAETTYVEATEIKAAAVTDTGVEATEVKAADASKHESYKNMRIDELRQIAAASAIQCKSKSKKDIIAALLGSD